MKKQYISPRISTYAVNSESLLDSASQAGSTDYSGNDYDSGINKDVSKTDGKDTGNFELSKDNRNSLWDFDEE